MSEKPKKRAHEPGRNTLLAMMAFFFLAFFLLALKDGKWESFVLSAVVPAIIYLGTAGISHLFPSDRLLLSLTNFLCALGVLVLYRLSPTRGMTQAFNYGVGVGCMMLCAMLVRYVRSWKWLTVLIMLGSIGLLALPLVIGKETNGAKNWFYIGGSSVQPSEVVKLALLISVSYLLSQRKVFLSLVFAGACLLMLMLQKDLGTALLYFGVTFILLYAATGSVPLMIGGVAGGAASLIAIVNGGAWGVGLGLGNAQVIPEYYNDFIFSVILHEFGLVFGLVVLCMYLFIIIRPS